MLLPNRKEKPGKNNIYVCSGGEAPVKLLAAVCLSNLPCLGKVVVLLLLLKDRTDWKCSVHGRQMQCTSEACADRIETAAVFVGDQKGGWYSKVETKTLLFSESLMAPRRV